MFGFALIIILAGFMILLGIGIWTRQRQSLGNEPELEQDLLDLSFTGISEGAVIVASEYGRLLYINETARQWLGIRTGVPDLEYVARNTRPIDSFRSLFGTHTHATFQIGDRWVEGTSHRIPSDQEIRVVVSLTEVRAGQTRQDSFDVSASMRIIDEIGDVINASLGVDQVIQSILPVISKHVDISAGEICLLDPAMEMLVQRGWLGDAAYVVTLATTSGGMYALDDGIIGWVAKNQQPLLVSDTHATDAVQPKLTDMPYQSFVAVPLMLGERLVGSLKLAHTERGHFSQGHLALLQAISKSVVTTIHNAELYSAQIQRIDDLASLQRLTHDKDLQDGVDSVYMKLNSRIAELTDAEISGVMLYDSNREIIVGQPPFFGLPSQLINMMSMDVSEDNPSARQIWEQQDYWLANDVSDEPMLDVLGLLPVVNAAGIRNLILLTMRIGQQRIGLIMVANKNNVGGFNNQDIQNLQLLVTQAAIVVENLRLFEREQRHDTELVGLQEITHAIGALSSEDEVYVYSDINTRIARLMGIEKCGILLFDSSGNRLIAQPPFYGVDDNAIKDYEINIAMNDVVRELWEEQEFWYSNIVHRDTLVFAMGLAEIAESIGIKKTLIASLVAGGQKIGAIQVSNKLDGSDFTDNDARLLLIFATQAAAILENARLVREVQRRAEESERLRLIAERAGNVVTLDETLAPVLSEVARLMNSQLVFMSVINDSANELVTHPRAVYSGQSLIQLSHIRYGTPLTLTTKDENQSLCVSQTQQPFVSNHVVADIDDGSLYDRLTQQLEVKQMLVVPLLIGDRSLGELGIANRETSLYTEDDTQLLTTVAAQLASTIDRVRLFEAAGENLDRRVKELSAISTVSNTLNETLELDTILDVIRYEASEALEPMAALSQSCGRLTVGMTLNQHRGWVIASVRMRSFWAWLESKKWRWNLPMGTSSSTTMPVSSCTPNRSRQSRRLLLSSPTPTSRWVLFICTMSR